MGLVAFLDSVVCRLCDHGIRFRFFINPYNFVPGGVYGAGIVLHNIFPSIQVGTFGYMFDVPLMITAVLVFGGQFGARTVVAALFTPGFMNILTRLVYSDAAFTADGINLDPALLLGGSLNLSNDLLLTCIIGAVVIGVGQGMVVRTQATTGGTDIIAMLLQKYAGIKFSTGIFLADCVVILSGLVVIGFGLGTGDSSGSGWVLTLYSLITIFICSRVVARVIDGASYDKLLFIISDENEKLRTFILEDLERSATFIKARGMYSEEEKDMIFLVVDRKEVHAVQRKVQEIDPKHSSWLRMPTIPTERASSLSRKRVRFRHSNFQKYRETGTAIVDSRFSVLILPGESGFATMNNEKINTLRPLQGAGRKLLSKHTAVR